MGMEILFDGGREPIVAGAERFGWEETLGVKKEERNCSGSLEVEMRLGRSKPLSSI
jgi:hypothetical protein